MKQDSPISLKLLVLTLSISLILCLSIYLYNLLDRRTKVVFCDVGKGNAVYIRIKNKTDILINAGPDKKILTCLSKQLPFYDRTLEYVLLTEETSSDIAGVMTIFGRYKINKLISNDFSSGTKITNEIKKRTENLNIQSSFITNGVLLDVYGLSITNIQLKSSSNIASNVLFIKEGTYRIELPGKASNKTMLSLLQLHKLHPEMNNLYLLQAPFYGSKDRLSKEFLMLADPTHVVISTKEQLIPPLSSKQLLDLLEAMNIAYSRTDKLGDLVFYLN